MKKSVLILLVGAATVLSEPRPSTATSILSRDINTYVIFAYSDLQMKGGDGTTTGFIFGGNVGVNKIDPQPGNNNNVVMNVGANGAFIMSNGTQLVADTSLFGTAANVFDYFSNCSLPGFDCKSQTGTIRDGPALTFSYATATEAIIAKANLPVLPFDPNRTTTDNAADAHITSSTTLPPGTYRNLSVDNGLTLSLGAGVYNFLNFQTGQHVTINASPGTVLYIDGQFKLGDDTRFGSSSVVPWVYAGSQGVGSNGTTVSFGENDVAYGHFFAPLGNINSGRSVDLSGTFWGDSFGLTDFNANIHFIPTSQVPEPAPFMLFIVALFGYGWRTKNKQCERL